MGQQRVVLRAVILLMAAGCMQPRETLPAEAAEARTQTGCIETGETYPHVEVSFRLKRVKGNPFAAEVWGIITRPQGRPVRVPAFYDGGDTWRVRYTPDRLGAHRVKITMGPAGRDQSVKAKGLSPSEFDVTAEARPGFVRRSPVHTQRFVFDNGEPYFPIGYNVAWSHGGNPAAFEGHHGRMREAGINWSRHWMAGFASLALDWYRDRKACNEGRLSLDIARKWDRIVRSAEENGIRFQLALQHHGQFSTTVSPNWDRCPWNAARGGFLETAAEFFTHERALELTRLKYRYIVARWGYSTAIMAWELFNEVQFTDGHGGPVDQTLGAVPGSRVAVVRWHAEMAALIRSLDPYGRLVTTSAMGIDRRIWEYMDYYQAHIYKDDMIAAVRDFGGHWTRPVTELDKPIFYGEADTDRGKVRLTGRSMLWAGIMSGGAGAAQKWHWDTMDSDDRFEDFGAIIRFVEATELAGRHFVPVPIRCASGERGQITFRPESAFGVKETAVEVPSDGSPVEGARKMPVYLHGAESKQAEGFAPGQSFNVETPEEWTFTMVVGQVAQAGAGASILVDGERVASRKWPAGEGDIRPTGSDGRMTARIPAGSHVVRVASTGEDWFRVGSYSFSGFVPALAALGCSAGDAACLWVYSRPGVHEPGLESGTGGAGGKLPDPAPIRGTVTVPDLKPGAYEVEWWDTEKGEPFRKEVVSTDGAGTLTIKTPPIARDAAISVKVAGTTREAATPVRGAVSERNARSWLAMARNWARSGDKAKAREYYGRILDGFPGSPEAATARDELRELGE